MHKVFSVISTSDRFEQLCILIESINKYYTNYGWSIHGVLQEYTDEQIETLKSLCIIENQWDNYDSRLGMFNARQEGMKAISKSVGDDFYVLVCLDDDIEFCEFTNFEKAVEYSLAPNVGLVSTNWVDRKSVV